MSGRILILILLACGPAFAQPKDDKYPDKDGLMRVSEGVHKMLDEKKVPHVWRAIPGGAHDFKVWKSDLYHFSQLIFRDTLEKKDEPKAEKKEPTDEGKPSATNLPNAPYPVPNAPGRSSTRRDPRRHSESRRWCRPVSRRRERPRR